MALQIEKYTLPAYWASALINADVSGMSDENEKELDQWIERVQPGNCVGCSEESWFSWRNDATNLGGDVMEFSFVRH